MTERHEPKGAHFLLDDMFSGNDHLAVEQVRFDTLYERLAGKLGELGVLSDSYGSYYQVDYGNEKRQIYIRPHNMHPYVPHITICNKANYDEEGQTRQYATSLDYAVHIGTRAISLVTTIRTREEEGFYLGGRDQGYYLWTEQSKDGVQWLRAEPGEGFAMPYPMEVSLKGAPSERVGRFVAKLLGRDVPHQTPLLRLMAETEKANNLLTALSSIGPTKNLRHDILLPIC